MKAAGFCWLVAGLVVSGCAGYKLGPTNGMPARSRSVQILPFSNQTLQPRLTDAVTSQLRKQLQRDGTYQLDSHGEADIVLSGVITRYDRFEITFVPYDVLTVRDYRVSVTAQVTARERGSGKVLFNQPIQGFTLIRVGSDLASAERQGVPLVAADLARNTVALLADGSW